MKELHVTLSKSELVKSANTEMKNCLAYLACNCFRNALISYGRAMNYAEMLVDVDCYLYEEDEYFHDMVDMADDTFDSWEG